VEREVKRVLLQLDHDRFASTYDAVKAYDAGIDGVLQYAGIAPRDVRDLIQGAIFSRRGEDLAHLAIFIGGSHLFTAEAILQAIQAAFFGRLRVSVMLDPGGCNTTAAAAVVKLLTTGEMKGVRTLVLAGTGAVGLRSSALLALEGAQVILASRVLDRAQAACRSLRKRFDVHVSPARVADSSDLCRALKGVDTVLTTGAAGVELLPEKVWVDHPSLRTLVDVNAVPPLGIGGIDAAWEGAGAQASLWRAGYRRAKGDDPPHLYGPPIRAE
jgi:hypothetical protein